MNNLSIRHLRAFREVSEHGSFTRAAESLHLTQSTLTATIKQLEQQVGLQLFDRTTRSVLLTGEGARFLPVAEKLLSDFDAAINDLQAMVLKQEGRVGIAASPSMISRYLPSVVKQFRDQFPGISVYLRDDGAGGLEQRVLDNDVDFAIGGNHSNQTELEYTEVLQDKYGLVVPKAHPLADRSEIIWSELPDNLCLYLTEDTGTRRQLNRPDIQQRLPAYSGRSVVEVSTPAGLAELVRQGLGCALLPALAASTDAFTDLCFVPLDKPELTRQICFIQRKQRSLSPAATALLEMTQTHLHNLNLPEHAILSL